MGWKNSSSSERWSTITSTIQAFATVGMFVVALIGVWKVTPIITYQTYQIEQKKEQEEKAETELPPLSAAKLPKHSPVTDRFVNDVLQWWSNQVESYQKIMDLIKTKDAQKLKISFRVVESTSKATEATPSPDFLIVTATSESGIKQVIKVPVNERAMNPNQYIQCKINQGMLYDLAPTDREKVEIAIGRYIQADMVSKVPPAYIQSDMSLKQLHDAISYHQNNRIEAISQIRALQGVIETALDE